MDNLQKLPKLSKGAKNTTEGFWAYNEKVMSDGAVPVKYKELIALGVALTTQCSDCLELHKKGAVEVGATEEEIAETKLIANINVKTVQLRDFYPKTTRVAYYAKEKLLKLNKANVNYKILRFLEIYEGNWGVEEFIYNRY